MGDVLEFISRAAVVGILIASMVRLRAGRRYYNGGYVWVTLALGVPALTWSAIIVFDALGWSMQLLTGATRLSVILLALSVGYTSARDLNARSMLKGLSQSAEAATRRVDALMTIIDDPTKPDYGEDKTGND